jgi:hypothetical protein
MQPDGLLRLRLWDVNSGRLRGEADASGLRLIRFGTFSADGTRLAVVNDLGRLGRRLSQFVSGTWLRMGSSTTRDLEADAQPGQAAVYQTSFSPDGNPWPRERLRKSSTCGGGAGFSSDASRRGVGSLRSRWPDAHRRDHDGELPFRDGHLEVPRPDSALQESDTFVSHAVLAPDGKRIAQETTETLVRTWKPTRRFAV